MFPKINEATSFKLDNVEEEIGEDILFDFKDGVHILVDGRFTTTDKKETIKQWIQVVLRTDSNKYKVYNLEENENFGISAYKYIGIKGINKGFILAEIKREIYEQLTEHNYIEYIENFQGDFNNRDLNISFEVILKNNEAINIREVLSL